MARHGMKRRVDIDHPIVYYAGGHWMRSGHPSRYDAWPVLHPLTDYQRRLVRA